MADIVEHRKCICVQFEGTNNNKVWQYTLYNDGTALTEWGRVGKALQSKKVSHDKALTKWAEKTNPHNAPDKLYTEVKAADCAESGGSKPVSNSGLKDIARKQIKHDNPIVQSLIDYLVQANAHQILSQSGGKIQYDTSTATFKTPLGVIDPVQVAEARAVLATLADLVHKGDYRNSKFSPNLNQYLRLIPHDVGMKRITPEGIFPSFSAVQQENDLLDGLEASFAGIISAPKTDDTKKKKKSDPKIFEVELFKVADRDIINPISDMYEKSKKKGHHGVYSLHVKDVYAVKIVSMKKAFDGVKDNIGNVMQLWHGTKASNLLSILRQGLVIPPANSAHCTGRMYGNGLYFSCVSTKALNYATGFWGSGGVTNRTFMFLAEVAMGRPYIAGGGWGSYPQKGYDSTWAKGGQSGVINDEMIVYRLNQANLVYLVEFK